jgi:NAD(P)-dependent dehydrogenase (short-subunit alcohol dehydrogenase family)
MTVDTPVVLVIQVSNPILACAARRFARNGLRVLGCHVSDISSDGPPDEVNIVNAGDLSRPDEANALAALAIERFGRLDVLVLAPEYPRTSELQGADDVVERANVVLRAWNNCVDASLPHMSRTGGRIVSLLSSPGKYRSGYFSPAARISSPNPEALVNGAILGMVRQKALECGPLRIRVNAVVAGMLDGSPELASMNERERRFLLEEISLRRFGTADEVAGVIAFLASPAADYITGDALDVNGGWWMS